MYRMMGFNDDACTEFVESRSLMKINLRKPYVGMLFNEEEDEHTI